MASMTQSTPRRAVLWQIPPDFEAWLRRVGLDERTEVWDGVLHVGPWPTGRHQALGGDLYLWLRTHWAACQHGRVFYERNVARPGLPDWRDDFRGPDLVLVKPDRYRLDLDTHFEGGPDVVVEIHTPGDESYEKLPFYFAVGVDEVWIIHRDTRVPQLFVRAAKALAETRSDRAGWLASPATGIELRAVAGARLAVRMAGAPVTEALLPALE